LAGHPGADEAILTMQAYLDQGNPARPSGVACWRAHCAMMANRRGNPEETLRVAKLGRRPGEFDNTNDHVRARLEMEMADALRMLDWDRDRTRELLRQARARCEINHYRACLATVFQITAKFEAAERPRRPGAVRSILYAALRTQLELDLPMQVVTRFMLARLDDTDPEASATHKVQAEAVINNCSGLAACPVVAKVLGHWQEWSAGAPDPEPMGISDPFWCL